MCRRLLLTSVVLAFPTLSSTILFMVSVSLVTLLIEQKCKPHVNAFLSAFCETCCWMILLFILYMLLLDSKLMPPRQEALISAILMITNAVSEGSSTPKSPPSNRLIDLPRNMPAPSLP